MRRLTPFDVAKDRRGLPSRVRAQGVGHGIDPVATAPHAVRLGEP